MCAGGGRSVVSWGRQSEIRRLAAEAGCDGVRTSEALPWSAMRSVTVMSSSDTSGCCSASASTQALVNAYWSVILLDVPDYRVVKNPLNRW